MAIFDNYKGAIFDLDGTLADSTEAWKAITIEWSKGKGIQVPETYQHDIQHMILLETAEYTKNLHNLDMTAEQILDEWMELMLHRYGTSVGLKGGAFEFIKRQKAKGIKLAIATSCFPKGCEAFLKNHSIYGYFDAFAYSDEVGKNKTNPDIYLLASERLGVDPRECLVFEDIYPALEGVRKAHMKFIAVYDEGADRYWQKFLSEADLAIKNYDEII